MRKDQYTQEQIKAKMGKLGFELLSTYKNCHSKIKIKCPCGETSWTTWNMIRIGCKCKHCRYIRSAKSNSLDYESVQKYFSDRGDFLLSGASDYKNNKSRLKYKCKCGRIIETILAQYQFTTYGCKSCSKKGDRNPAYKKNRPQLKVRRKFRSYCSIYLRELLACQFTDIPSVLGYEKIDLLKRLESFPNWEKIKDSGFSIDHIFPVSAFQEYGIKDIKLINSLDNLQPLTKSENSKKHAKYDKEEFETWLKSKKVKFRSRL